MVKLNRQTRAQQQRDDLAGEHAVGDAGQMVLACCLRGRG